MPTAEPIPTLATRFAALYSALEPLAKTIVAAVGICYALGLLIKNIYLARWSMFSGKLLEVEYVLSGALFMFLVLLGSAFWICTFGILRSIRLGYYYRSAHSRTYNKFWTPVRLHLRTTSLVLGGALGVALILALVYGRRTTSSDYIVTLGAVLVFPSAMFWMRRPATAFWHHVSVAQRIPGELGMKLFWTVALLFGTLACYVTVIYPTISPVYGGGKHTVVFVSFASGGDDIAQVVGVAPVGSSKPKLYAVQLLCEDEKYLTIAAPLAGNTRKAVQIPRDHVYLIVTSASTAR